MIKSQENMLSIQKSFSIYVLKKKKTKYFQITLNYFFITVLKNNYTNM